MTQKPPSRLRNLGIAGILALTGFVALIIITLALLTGLWLDSLIGRRGPATICLLVLSVPISLFFMVRIVLALVSQLDLPGPVQQEKHLPDEKEE